MANQRPEQTESLFNVTPARRRSYLLSFIAYSLIGYGVVIWHHAADGGAPLVIGDGEAGAATTVMSIMLGFAIAHAAAFGLALTTAEITGGTMVIADWLRAKYVTPLIERRRAEGRAEVNRVWREWNRRRIEAQERGEPFNEPEPYSDGD